MTRFSVLLLLALTGCFSRFRMTDREIRQHYAQREAAGFRVRPTFHTIENDTAKVFVATTGADTLPPLLLIHGAPGAWYGYIRMVDDTALQRRFQILSVERPGYGHSRKGGQRSIREIDQQAGRIALALSLNHSGKPAIVLGRSYGAPIALRLATLQPERVGHLMLISSAIDPDKEKFWWFSKFGRSPLVQWALPKPLNTATDEKYAHVAELRKLLPQWSRIQAPVTVLQGGTDWIVDTTNFSFAKRVLAGKQAEFMFLPQSGHLITSSNPDLIRSLVLQKADSLAGKTRTSALGGASSN
jgi:pimeloyl-ACP methyl ester carboxylesterase